MGDKLTTNNTEYFRGVDGNLYYSTQLILNNNQIAFYNSESSILTYNNRIKEILNKTLVNYFKKYNIPNNKEGIIKLIEILREKEK